MSRPSQEEIDSDFRNAVEGDLSGIRSAIEEALPAIRRTCAIADLRNLLAIVSSPDATNCISTKDKARLIELVNACVDRAIKEEP